MKLYQTSGEVSENSPLLNTYEYIDASLKFTFFPQSDANNSLSIIPYLSFGSCYIYELLY